MRRNPLPFQARADNVAVGLVSCVGDVTMSLSETLAFGRDRGGSRPKSRAATIVGERKVFWRLQGVWWPLMIGFYVPLSAAWGSMQYSPWAFVVGFGLAILSTFAFRAVYLRFRPAGLAGTMAILLVTIVTLATIEIFLTSQLYERFNPDFGTPDAKYYVLNVLSEFFFLLSWTALYVSFVEHSASRQQRERLAQAESMARDAQLAMLRFQINPHFMFNTLNAISSLVLDKRNDAAERMLSRLAQFMRYALDQSSAQMVSVAEEIATQRLYLLIEQERFGARLETRFDIDPACEECLVPGLILQPLVENAVKHAVAPFPSGGAITIRAHRDGDELVLSVEDDGPGVSSLEGVGVGLRNTVERLRVHYGGEERFEAGPAANGGFRALMRLPCKPRSDADARDAG